MFNAIFSKIIERFKCKKEEVLNIEEDELFEPTELESKEPQPAIAFALAFVTDIYGNTNIMTNFSEYNELNANGFGRLLFDISEGNLNKGILDVLVTSANNTPSIAPFVETVINRWVELKKKEEELEELPIVMPDQFITAMQKDGDDNE